MGIRLLVSNCPVSLIYNSPLFFSEISTLASILHTQNVKVAGTPFSVLKVKLRWPVGCDLPRREDSIRRPTVKGGANES
jgi:hypothetical protein